MIIILDKLFKNYDIIIPLFDLFTQYIGLDFNGDKLNINIPDESGILTLNVGQFYFKNDELKIGFNLRTPINTTLNSEPIAIGGATYARAFDNFVSFGANLPGQKDMCHQTDEFISIDNLIIAHEIYCRAIKELLFM